ncbi:MAG TPA: hypothetical protein VFH70_06860 [Acidimicrobiales bacterium]|nr:hypothetical protein [Acidimicrobiales bacterium]
MAPGPAAAPPMGQPMAPPPPGQPGYGAPGAPGGYTTPGSYVGGAVSRGQSMNAQQLMTRLQISSSDITINDLIGAGGGLLLFIAYFVSIVTVGSVGYSLSGHGGFWGALVPIFGPISTIALMIPVARKYGPIFLSLGAGAWGIAIGVRDAIGGGVGYGIGWWMAFIGGIALCYAWCVRLMHADKTAV